MRKALLSFFIVLSLLVAPAAHAFGIGGEGDSCHSVENGKKLEKSEKKQDSKSEKKGHCCSHTHANLSLVIVKTDSGNTKTSFSLDEERITSLLSGPPLKPPSHA